MIEILLEFPLAFLSTSLIFFFMSSMIPLTALNVDSRTDNFVFIFVIRAFCDAESGGLIASILFERFDRTLCPDVFAEDVRLESFSDVGARFTLTFED